MRVLLVVAHPLQDSLCMHLAETIEQQLRSFGHTVERLDLYRETVRSGPVTNLAQELLRQLIG